MNILFEFLFIVSLVCKLLSYVFFPTAFVGIVTFPVDVNSSPVLSLTLLAIISPLTRVIPPVYSFHVTPLSIE